MINLFKKIIRKIKFIIRTFIVTIFSIFDYYRSNNIYKEPSICAFYQCYKRPKCVIATLNLFRKIYPTSPVYLFCDQGEDMSHIASYFNCKYEYLPNRTGHDKRAVCFLNREPLIAWLKRILVVAKNSQEDFVIILEEDVMVYKKVKKLKFDLNGIKPCTQIGKEATRFLKTINNSIPNYINNIYYGGGGGTLINRNFIINNFSNIEKLEKAIDGLYPYWKNRFDGWLPSDACLTMLVIYFGGTIGPYYGFAEMGVVGLTELSHWKYMLRPLSGRIEVIHSDKSLYNLPLSEDENRIFLGKY